jgi:hypothetical protein
MDDYREESERGMTFEGFSKELETLPTRPLSDSRHRRSVINETPNKTG